MGLRSALAAPMDRDAGAAAFLLTCSALRLPIYQRRLQSARALPRPICSTAICCKTHPSARRLPPCPCPKLEKIAQPFGAPERIREQPSRECYRTCIPAQRCPPAPPSLHCLAAVPADRGQIGATSRNYLLAGPDADGRALRRSASPPSPPADPSRWTPFLRRPRKASRTTPSSQLSTNFAGRPGRGDS